MFYKLSTVTGLNMGELNWLAIERMNIVELNVIQFVSKERGKANRRIRTIAWHSKDSTQQFSQFYSHIKKYPHQCCVNINLIHTRKKFILAFVVNTSISILLPHLSCNDTANPLALWATVTVDSQFQAWPISAVNVRDSRKFSYKEFQIFLSKSYYTD